VVILFDRGAQLDFALWKILVLVAILFAICAYKVSTQRTRRELIEGEPDAAEK
jgi:hypothetical protein